MRIKKLLVHLSILGFFGIAAPAQISANRLQDRKITQTISQKNWKELEDIVLEKALKSQVVMFGERHKTYRADNDFVIGIIPRLSEHFAYLALELPRNSANTSLNNLADYANGKITRKDLNPDSVAKEKRDSAGWFDLIDSAREAGFKITCYDANHREVSSPNERERIASNNLNELIFDKNPDAKVIIYCGAMHTSEDIEDSTYGRYLGFPLFYNFEDIMCLGFHLNEKFKDKLFTVSLIIPYDTPDCDLIIDLEKGTYKYQNN